MTIPTNAAHLHAHDCFDLLSDAISAIYEAQDIDPRYTDILADLTEVYEALGELLVKTNAR